LLVEFRNEVQELCVRELEFVHYAVKNKVRVLSLLNYIVREKHSHFSV
jgi:hypothetical protein